MPKTMSNGSLRTYSSAQLQKELARRQDKLRDLQREHQKIIASAQNLQAQIERLGGAGVAVAGVGLRKRPRNAMSLRDALVTALKGKTLTVEQAADAVRKAGYKSNAANFRIMVNLALIKDNRIKRVARGQYTAK